MSVRIQEQVVRLSGAYPTADLDRLLAQLSPLVGIDTPTVLTIDLRRLEGIGAPSVAVFAATVLEVKARGVLQRDSRIVLPSDDSVRKRLEVLGVLELLVDWFPVEPPNQSTARGSCPCQWFSADQPPDNAARRLSLAIAEACHTESFAGDVIWYTLNEIAQNVVDHAHVRGGAVAIAEVTMGGMELEVAIADSGVGVRASLMGNPVHDDISEIEALRVAVSPGGSSRIDPPTPAGLGLFLTQLILQDNEGALTVRSGAAELTTGSLRSESVALEPMAGTLVVLRFRTDKPVRLESILPS